MISELSFIIYLTLISWIKIWLFLLKNKLFLIKYIVIIIFILVICIFYYINYAIYLILTIKLGLSYIIKIYIATNISNI